VPPHAQPPGGSQKASVRDKRSQSLVPATGIPRKAPRITHAPPVASRDTHPKISDGKIAYRLIKVLGLPALFPTEGPIRRTREGGSEWEPIKILLEGDRNSNKMNTASNTRLRLTTKVGQAHVATGVPLDLGTNTPPTDPRNAAENQTSSLQTHTGQTGEHNRSDRSLLVKLSNFH
jgi:hypothetical protein